jgi:glycine/D-amino acid oxidase-like deaminating enzyme
VLVVSPCSGHGFKFGPVIGKVVSDILIKDETIPVFEDNRFYCRLFYHLGVNLK